MNVIAFWEGMVGKQLRSYGEIVAQVVDMAYIGRRELTNQSQSARAPSERVKSSTIK